MRVRVLQSLPDLEDEGLFEGWIGDMAPLRALSLIARGIVEEVKQEPAPATADRLTKLAMGPAPENTALARAPSVKVGKRR